MARERLFLMTDAPPPVTETHVVGEDPVERSSYSSRVSEYEPLTSVVEEDETTNWII